MSDRKPPYIALAGVGIAVFGFFAYETVANVTSSSAGYVVVARHGGVARRPFAATAFAAPRHAAAAVVAVATRAPAPAPKTAASGAPRPSPSPVPSTSASPAPSPTPSARPHVAPSAVAGRHAVAAVAAAKSSALRRGTDSARAAAARAVAAATDERAQRPAQTASFAVAASTPEATVESQAPATPAPTPAAVALAPVATPAAPAYAPDRIVTARVRFAVEPELPDDPTLAGIHATSYVVVTIGPTGHVVRATVERSSGYAKLDGAALRAASASTYQAPLIDGKPATESYRMVYEFK